MDRRLRDRGGSLSPRASPAGAAEQLVFAENTSAGCRGGGAHLSAAATAAANRACCAFFATLLAPAAGRLLWGGVPVLHDAARLSRPGSYVCRPSGRDEIAGAQPREMLGFWAALRGWCDTRNRAGACRLRGSEGGFDRPYRWLSAGQRRRRAALARLVLAPAPIWLLDEPTAALDSDGEECLLAAIAAHCEAGGRAAIATHQPLLL